MDLDKLRELCLSFPGATEDLKWGADICFSVGQKMFCVTGASGGTSFKVTPEEFEEMAERNGIIPAPYMARNKWVMVQEFNKLKPKEWKKYVTESYELVRANLPKKVQQNLGK